LDKGLDEAAATGWTVASMKEDWRAIYPAQPEITAIDVLLRPKPTPELLKLQADIIAAAKPFMVETGPIGAFSAPHGDAALDAAIVEYVSTYVPKMAGERFNPHVSTGVAPRDDLDQMLAEPFEGFAFSPAGAAVFQLGPFGTAAKQLKAWDLKP
jgi:hypothetical protein